MSEELLTVDDVAAELKVPRSTAYEYMRQMVRVVLSGKAGGHRNVRVSRRALEAWVRARTCEPTPSPSSTSADASGGATGRTSAGRPGLATSGSRDESCEIATMFVPTRTKRRR
jgi:hypothetical protein